MSGVYLPNGAEIRKGAPDATAAYVKSRGGSVPAQLEGVVAKIGARGATPLVVPRTARSPVSSPSRTC
jgi:potassium-transporting ATPase ATP-binding subunit